MAFSCFANTTLDPVKEFEPVKNELQKSAACSYDKVHYNFKFANDLFKRILFNTEIRFFFVQN